MHCEVNGFIMDGQVMFEMRGEGVEGADPVKLEARGEIEKMTINPIKRDNGTLMSRIRREN